MPPSLPGLSKTLILVGLLLVAAGIVFALLGHFISFGQLPGDIVYEKGNFHFYLPVVSCLILSGVLSVVLLVIRWFSR
jgi:hypothetical protein